MSKLIGVLTAGGDSPGLNAALRGIGKAVIKDYDMQLIGFRDGFRGLVQNRSFRLPGGLYYLPKLLPQAFWQTAL